MEAQWSPVMLGPGWPPAPHFVANWRRLVRVLERGELVPRTSVSVLRIVHASLGALRPESLHFPAGFRIRQVTVSGCLVVLQVLELA
jgi:hypothetical protein